MRRINWSFLAITCAALLWAQPGECANRRSVDIFVNGKLASGITLENGRANGNQVVTSPIGKSWGKPAFHVKGLNVDLQDR